MAESAIEVAHAAANRWTGLSYLTANVNLVILFLPCYLTCKHLTDNTFTLQQWCSKNFPNAKEQLEHLYEEVLLDLHF